MEIDFKYSFHFVYREFQDFSTQFKLTLGLVLSVVTLFSMAPEDADHSFPVLNGSRFLWTMAIPVISSSCVGIWAFMSLNGKLSNREVFISAIGTPFLIFQTLQFATTSPVGVDGWFFLSSAQYYSQFGEAGAANYMTHPLVMMPVDMWIRTFGGTGREIAAILGFLMSLSWIIIIVNALSKSPNFKLYGVLILCGLSLFFLASGWYPLRYSAHLLGLLIGHFLLHRRDGRGTSTSDVILASMLGISHAFSPIVFGTIFYLESLVRNTNSSRMRNLGLITSLVFISWNSDLAVRTLSFYRPMEDSGLAFILLPFFLISIAFFSFSAILEQRKGVRNSPVFGGGMGCSNLSIVIGCIVCIPIILIADTQTGASRFAHRMVTYSAVPFCWAGGWILTQAFQFFESKVIDGEGSKIRVILISFLSISSGVGSGILQVSFVENTEVMPEDAVHCWDMVESTGALNALAGFWDGETIIISDQIHPPVVHKYFSFAKQGDPDKIRFILDEKLVGVLETPDMFGKIAQEAEIDYQGWQVAGEVPGACRLWVNPVFIDEFDPSMTWEKLDTSWY